ncbi:hypothetical protein C0993_004620 [Termitomyces sp. T159_Od127]|nr:hypothetical protein C0993_004620 [Termitomyces sp. T159_Od127]
MSDFIHISQKNHLRRQELYEKSNASQEERFQKADAVREFIFAQRQKDRACGFVIEQETRGKLAERYSTAFLSDSRQRLEEKCHVFKTALEEQFDRLMERRREIGEVAKGQSSDQDKLMPLPPDRSSGLADSQSVTLSPPSSESPSSSPSLKSPIQSMSTESNNDQQDAQVSRSRPPSMGSLLLASCSLCPENLNSLTLMTSPESNDQQSPPLVEQGSPEGCTQSDGVEEGKYHSSFMYSQEQRQNRFLQEERERRCQFAELEAQRDGEESYRSRIFDSRMEWLSEHSQIEQFRCQEDEYLTIENRRSIAFQGAEEQRWTIFNILMSYIKDQAQAEAVLDKSRLKHRQDMLLTLYKIQVIKLNQHITEDQIVRFESMRGKYCPRPFPTKPTAIAQTEVGIVCFMNDMHARQGFTVLSLGDMQMLFERSQKLRDEVFQKAAKERNNIFTINEAKRKAEFMKVQRKRKETFDHAEELRASGFEEAQQQRELEFQANERKREDNFEKLEARRKNQARRAQESREKKFESTMLELQQKCADDEKRQMEELERFCEELLVSRQQGLTETPRQSALDWLPVRLREMWEWITLFGREGD